MAMNPVTDGIWLLDIPLRNSPLKNLNCYLIAGSQLNLVIDTGFNTEEAQDLMSEALAKLNWDATNTALYLTHLHSDHTGLASWFDDNGYQIYMGQVDGDRVRASLEDRDRWASSVDRSLKQGLAEDHLDMRDHPGFKFRPSKPFSQTQTAAGGVIDTGDIAYQIVDLPGHTPGLQALWSPETGHLFSSDHILGSITPNITYWDDETGDSLGNYLASLDVVDQMPVTRIFPAHRNPVPDHRGRIAELRQHHSQRLDEVRKALERHGALTVREVTMRMHWDIRAKSWEDFPDSQKWFAAGEAQAHLEHLRALGEVQRVEDAGVWRFSLT